MNKRAVILRTAIVFGFVLVAIRLADLMLLNHERLSERAKSQYTGKKDITVKRGGIYDRRGRVFAANLDVESVYCNALEVDSPEKTASALSEATGLSYGPLLKKVSSDKGFSWVKRKLSPEAAGKLKGLKLKGVGFMQEPKRVYPKGKMASHIVGFVGIDNQPLEGLELKYEENLRGRAGSVLFEKDAGGRPLSEGFDFQSSGNSLVLTMDEGLQYIVEKELDRALEEWEASSASAIMMNPFSGEILAMANRPTYDLNDPSRYKPSARRNRAITDLYEPGSTFKIVTAAGALEEGVVGTETKFDCSKGYIRVGRKAIWDTHNHGVIPFREVIQTSSNVGTIQAAQKLGEKRLYEYAMRFGFGKKTGIDLPGEAGGVLKPPKKWSGTTLAAMSIGYEVAVNPLQVLRAYSAVANGGLLMKPYLVSKIISPEGDVLMRAEPEIQGRAISRETAEILKGILISVTQQGGTASKASIDGNQVAGKTGTAKLIDSDAGGYSDKRYASSFVGFVPADDPKVALIIVVYAPKGEHYGGLVAAPLFRQITDKTLAYLNVPREDSFKENVLVVRARGAK
jgi:cell division protein FtsI (penicillin-binding protein 3)